ncbi:SDR family oxidoreductase [Algibacter lectus]|uniref:NAD(P)H dehydrogenase (Quinone) n=1 Tax=Algibacter lectus TaxID=221126 RepID=A0A4V3HGU2_9FLAO|nr:SDR family oxidoreductase [Algibacter lectus]MWW24710.1 NAD(P)H-binding protein [Algibacter lectus]TDY62731.1 NAD(P)H dehydrogenase (quinone) [Algibacter lectus]SFC92115.1 NAD(P)H dehydrogenase (quinone) [Algibacter lectus]
MKIAVTSANGKLGSTIVENLIELVGKEHVIGIARSPEKAKHLGIEIRKGDYNSREEFDAALQGIDVVMLLSGMDEPDKRIQQHRNVIDAAVSNGVKKIVYTSIVGDEKNTAFSPVVQSNRQTEKDVQNSGLDYAIGRNGIYIEPDLEYLDTYIEEGEIRNCAGDGKCAYTSRAELGFAYSKMLIEDKHNGKIYNLVGHAISQSELADYINLVFNTKLKFTPVSVAAYLYERKTALGDFLGTVIAGIYEGIKNGSNNVLSDFELAAGRPHKSVEDIMRVYKEE